MFRIQLLGAAVAVCAFSGCASIVNGQNQSLSVTTKSQDNDVAGAKCTLENNKGTWYVTTPGSVMIHRSFNDLSVNCSLDGYRPATSMVKSATKAMAFGNILFGGVIGAGVDMSTGAAYDYPTTIVVDMGGANISGDSAGAKLSNATPSVKPLGVGDLRGTALKAYEIYQTKLYPRGFVIADSGRVFWVAGRQWDGVHPSARALENCKQAGQPRCRVIAEDGRVLVQ